MLNRILTAHLCSLHRHLRNETTTYPVLNRLTGQRGNNNVANAETLHHFLNSDIDNIHDITRQNIGNSILQPITLEADLRTADNSVNYSRASISKPLALDIDPKIKTNIWALEYIDLSCLLNKKQSKVKFQPTETSEGGMAWEKQQPPTYRFENISHWLSAFHIFVSIYSEKYPKETGSLMKYADIIQTLARRSCDVAAYIYDRTYREWREHDYESLPWDQVNNELYSEAMSLGLKIKFDNLSKNLKSLPFPVSGAPQRSTLWSSKKYCYSFNNNDGRCERGQN